MKSKRLKKSSKECRWALVTGASSGIGLAIARRLARKGYCLVIVSRSAAKLQQALEILLADGSPEVIVKPMDMAHRSSADKLFDWCVADNIHVDILVNDAGMFIFNDLLCTSPARIKQITNLHIITVTTMCRLFAADMAIHGGGYILNLSSYSRWMPLPGLALYGASKAYIHNFTLSFGKEVREKGVYVTSVSPAGVATDLYGLSKELQHTALKWGILLTPEDVAKQSLNALFRGKRDIVPGWYNRLWIPVLENISPRATRFLRRKTMQFQK